MSWHHSDLHFFSFLLAGLTLLASLALLAGLAALMVITYELVSRRRKPPAVLMKVPLDGLQLHRRPSEEIHESPRQAGKQAAEKHGGLEPATRALEKRLSQQIEDIQSGRLKPDPARVGKRETLPITRKDLEAKRAAKAAAPAGKPSVIARDKFGNKIGFTGATVHEAAVRAMAAGYKYVFNKDGTPYTPPKPAPAAPATPTPITTTTTTTTPPLRIDSNGEPPVRCDSRATEMKTLEQTMLLEGYNSINRDYAVTRWFMTLRVNASSLLWQFQLANLKPNKMNNNQRIAIAVALVIIGSVLLYVMSDVGYDARGRVFNTLIFSWEDGWKAWPSGIPRRKYLYITHGIPGVLLGLVTPLGLWAVAAYIALGSKKIDANP